MVDNGAVHRYTFERLDRYVTMQPSVRAGTRSGDEATGKKLL
jgi:hypothetical protein